MKNLSKIAMALALLLNMVQSSSFKGESPDASFENQSSNKNDWTYDPNASYAGFVIGFSVFGVAYIFVIVALMHDIMTKLSDYDDEIKEDLKYLKELGYDIESDECRLQLEMRLSGEKADSVLDDQLLAAAMTVDSAEYKKYM